MDKTATKVSQEKNTVVAKADKNSASEISIKQFLDFLRTAYQVSESVEETLSSAEGTAEAVDWIKLKNTELVKPKIASTHSVTNNSGIIFHVLFVLHIFQYNVFMLIFLHV